MSDSRKPDKTDEQLVKSVYGSSIPAGDQAELTRRLLAANRELNETMGKLNKSTECHSARLVRLTRALVWLTVVLVILTFLLVSLTIFLFKRT